MRNGRNHRQGPWAWGKLAERWSPMLLALVGFSGVSVLGGCGLESCAGFGDFTATPEPEAVVSGRLVDMPVNLLARAGGAEVRISALSVDDAILAETTARIGEPFELALGPGLDHFNVRILVRAGALVLKAVAPEAAAGARVELGDVGVTSTAAAQIVERFAARERRNLASTPPGTLAEVLVKASGEAEAVVAFRSLVGEILDAAELGDAEPSLELSAWGADAAALERAGLSPDAYAAALEAAVDASLVPVVCDPSRIRVLFTVDASGQAKDGNGAAQFIRQPSQEGKIFLGITLDPQSPVPDSAGALRPRLTPNDPATEMFDDGTRGDEVAGDGVFSRVLDLPRGMRVLYKYTNGSAGAGFTGTEEWPGNARILQTDDVLTGNASGAPDCVVVRRDSFGDEASNKNFVNLHARLGGGDLGYDDDLGGTALAPSAGEGSLLVGGLRVDDLQRQTTLTPDGVPEARENGICEACPSPLTVSAEDDSAPRLISAAFVSIEQTRVVFSEDVDVQSAGRPSNYILVDEDNRALRISHVQVVGGTVTLTHDAADPRRRHRVAVRDVTDASLAQNPVAEGARINVGPDLTPPVVERVRPDSIVALNPSARPGNPESGEVVVVTFSEVLDRISAENVDNYQIEGLEVLAAFQRGREVLLVTSAQTRDAPYTLQTGPLFDVAGNVALGASGAEFRGLSLSLVTFRVVVDHAWRSVDGSERGLPPGSGLYLTGTVLKEARAVDGSDLRVRGRTDVAGLPGFELLPGEESAAGAPVYALSLRLPAGSYAYKFAHGRPGDAASPPPTLETVTKSLVTRNDVAGVAVDPQSALGKDGVSYAGARLSLNGQDEPGPGVLFKRENPDDLLILGTSDRTLPVVVVGTWRDVPFGVGRDYDDGLVEIPMWPGEGSDGTPPRLLGARARDSESVLLSFDEAVFPGATGVLARVTGEEGDLPVSEVFVGQPLPNQVVVRCAPMSTDAPYTLLVAGVQDAAGNEAVLPVTIGFTSPPVTTPFAPLLDEEPPRVSAVNALSPTALEVRFSERLASPSVTPTAFGLGADAGEAPQIVGVRLEGGGLRVVITTTQQERQAAYRLQVQGVQDLAGNAMDAVEVPFAGFGEFVPPTLTWARAVTPTRVALRFNEPVTADTAGSATRYLIDGLSITAVQYGASDELRGAAFNGAWAPLATDLVILSTSPMEGGRAYTVRAEGVEDTSGNPSDATASFSGIASTPTVDVVLSYLVSDTATVLGVGAGGSSATPSRALSPGTLSEQREGLFVIGTALTENGASPVADHPFTAALRGFPDDGAPLGGEEPRLVDDGTGGDLVAGDRVFTTTIRNVPLGSTLSYKAFAPFTSAFGAANPQVPGAAFADPAPGPSVFSDGQEYPGNDNAVYLVADVDGDGRIVIENLFGDEITYKRVTGRPAFHFAVDVTRRRE